MTWYNVAINMQFKLLAVLTQHQIPLRYAMDGPILPHYPPCAPMSLSKSNPMNRLVFAQSRNNPDCLAQRVLMCTTGTLSPSTVRKRFDLPGPDVLADS